MAKVPIPKKPLTVSDIAPEHEQLRDPVYEWRVEQLLALGIDETLAAVAAAGTVDLGRVREHVKHGCEANLALRIEL